MTDKTNTGTTPISASEIAENAGATMPTSAVPVAGDTREGALNLFEAASRKKFRYPSVKGVASVITEELWTLPMRDDKRPEVVTLNQIAQLLHKQKDTAAEVNFVGTTVTSEQVELNQKIEMVTYVIAVREQEDRVKAEAGKEAVRKANLRRIVLDSLAEDQVAEVKGMTTEQKLALLADLD